MALRGVGPVVLLSLLVGGGMSCGRDRVLSRARERPGPAAPSPSSVARALPEHILKTPAVPKGVLSLSTDLPCIVTVDGVEIGRLRRGSGDTFLVTDGRHVVVAVETDSGRSWARLIEIREGEAARAEIRFQQRMEDEATGFRPASPDIRFVSIAAGEFWMGSDRGMPHMSPRHRVRISKGFELGRSPVTQEQWKRVMNRNPSPWDLEGAEQPAINVSWDDIQEFLQRLNRMDPHYLYRLPTEAEWEYACRSGSESDVLERDPNARLGVGALRANSPPARPTAWGVYDIRGALSEWCQDWYDQDYYRRSPAEDPPGPPMGSQKAFRGGAFASNALGLEPAARGYQDPTSRSTYTGFRLVRVPR